MQANWSLILNVLLLVGVVIAIVRTLRARRHPLPAQLKQPVQPFIGQSETPHYDDIISVRKVNRELDASRPTLSAAKLHPPGRASSLQAYGQEMVEQNETETPSTLKSTPSFSTAAPLRATSERERHKNNPSSGVHTHSSRDRADLGVESSDNLNDAQIEVVKQDKKEDMHSSSSSVMMFLLAKENRQLAGYELLQTVLAAGLRFGEGQLFHRHQHPNGQGPVLCSLAAATATGVFDLQNIGAFVVRGLCLFMQASGNPTIDAERFEIMLDTAKQLSEGLDTYLLDEQRKPLTDMSVERYHRRLKLDAVEVLE